MSNKAEKLIPVIMAASTQEEAIGALIEIAETMHLTQNYSHLIGLKDQLDAYENKFKDIIKQYNSIRSQGVRDYDQLHNIRLELNFLYQELNDELGFEINKAKILNEEKKTVIRAEAMRDLKNDPEFQKDIKATSASALRDLVGAASVYQEYVSMASVAYGMYSEFHKLMDGIKMMTDSLASECRQAQYVEQKDVK